MSFIANLLKLLNWNVRRRTHTLRGDDRSASESEAEEDTEHPEFGLEFVADRAGDHEQTIAEQPVFRQLPSGKLSLQTDEKDEWLNSDVAMEVRE